MTLASILKTLNIQPCLSLVIIVLAIKDSLGPGNRLVRTDEERMLERGGNCYIGVQKVSLNANARRVAARQI